MTKASSVPVLSTLQIVSVPVATYLHLQWVQRSDVIKTLPVVGRIMSRSTWPPSLPLASTSTPVSQPAWLDGLHLGLTVSRHDGWENTFFGTISVFTEFFITKITHICYRTSENTGNYKKEIGQLPLIRFSLSFSPLLNSF